MIERQGPPHAKQQGGSGAPNRDLFSGSRQPTDWLCWTLIYHTTLEYTFWSGTFPMVKYHPRIQPLNTLFPLYKNYWVCLPSMDRLPLSRSWGGGPPPERQASPHPPWVLLQGFQLIDQFLKEKINFWAIIQHACVKSYMLLIQIGSVHSIKASKQKFIEWKPVEEKMWQPSTTLPLTWLSPGWSRKIEYLNLLKRT